MTACISMQDILALLGANVSVVNVTSQGRKTGNIASKHLYHSTYACNALVRHVVI